MADPVAGLQGPEGDDELPLGLSLSELLGEVWSPIGHDHGSEDEGWSPAEERRDLEAGELRTWNR